MVEHIKALPDCPWWRKRASLPGEQGILELERIWDQEVEEFNQRHSQ